MKRAEQNPDPTDSELMSRICLGDEEAFVALYRRRRDDVHRFAFAMSRSVSIAQDVTQDVFVNVLQNAARFDAAKGSVHAWLLGCARHLVLDRMRLEARWTVADTADVGEHADAALDGAEVASERQRIDMLHAAILNLPAEYREAVVLCELEELSYAECAAVLGCPIGTVRSRLHRGRLLLAARLRPAAEPDDAPERWLEASEGCR